LDTERTNRPSQTVQSDRKSWFGEYRRISFADHLKFQPRTAGQFHLSLQPQQAIRFIVVNSPEVAGAEVLSVAASAAQTDAANQ
jgi:hypothetical protein